MKSKKPTVSEEDKALFRSHMDKVERLKPAQEVIVLQKNKPEPSLCILQQDSGCRGKPEPPLYDHQNPVTSEESLYFNKGGLQEKAQRKLKRGRFPSEAALDLHGLTVTQAYQILMDFLEDCTEQNIRHIRIIHGKGHSKASDHPILKNKVNNWLRSHPQVLAFSSATKNDGGTGVLYVWLRQIN